MKDAERNRQIKKILAERFGKENVSVRMQGSWRNITIKAPSCEETLRNKRYWEIRDTVWSLIKNFNFGIYYDDMNLIHPEVTINVDFEEV